MKQRYSLALIVFLVGCATVAKMQFEDIYGKPNPTRFDQPLAVAANGVSFRHDVQPILNQRCVVCHACYDGPCQLKLTSWEGLARGASQEDVYATRLSETQPTRLGIDAQTPSEWRKLGFFPVLNEYVPTPAAALQASLLARAIELKRRPPPACQSSGEWRH